MSRAPPWRSNRQLFEGILWLLTLRGPVGQIYRTHPLARQRVGLDDALGRRRNPVTGGAG